jgi:hypothetical protein
MGCCWVGLEGGKGLREIGFRFWDFRDLGKRLQTNRIQILNLNSRQPKIMHQHECHK